MKSKSYITEEIEVLTAMDAVREARDSEHDDVIIVM